MISLSALIKLKSESLYDKSLNQAIVPKTYFLITTLKAPLIDVPASNEKLLIELQKQLR